MYTNWKELKDTLLDLYRKYYEHDKKYRDYLENNHHLQSLEEYRHSFSKHKPAPYSSRIHQGFIGRWKR